MWACTKRCPSTKWCPTHVAGTSVGSPPAAPAPTSGPNRLFTRWSHTSTQAVHEASLVAPGCLRWLSPGTRPATRNSARLLALSGPDRSVLLGRSKVPGLARDHRPGPLRIACTAVIHRVLSRTRPVGAYTSRKWPRSRRLRAPHCSPRRAVCCVRSRRRVGPLRGVGRAASASPATSPQCSAEAASSRRSWVDLSVEFADLAAQPLDVGARRAG